MVARSSNNQIREYKLKNRSTPVSADPRLDRTKDASLKHKRKHGAVGIGNAAHGVRKLEKGCRLHGEP